MGLVLLPNGEPATPEVETLAVAPSFKKGTSAVENFHDVRFESELDAERWMSKCIVRWDWVVGMFNTTPDSDEPTWVARARRVAGAIHDTKHENYKFESGDVKVTNYVHAVKVKENCFAVVSQT